MASHRVLFHPTKKKKTTQLSTWRDRFRLPSSNSAPKAPFAQPPRQRPGPPETLTALRVFFCIAAEQQRLEKVQGGGGGL